MTTTGDSSLDLAIDELSKSMGELIAERAKRLVCDMTNDEKWKLLHYDQCMRTAKALCVAVSDSGEGQLLYMQFSAEAIKKDIKALRRIKARNR